MVGFAERMRDARRALACCVLACIGAADLAAQPATEAPWEERFFNPQPLADDVHLPMPCGGTMVFRRIDVLREGAGSRRIVVGGNDPRFQYAEANREEFVEGAFTDRGDPKRRYFYMAKYEVSALQHAALNGDCRVPTREGLKPAVRVTWFDGVQAAQRYSEWLLQNARDKLPREGGTSGFLRLPTEAEWEFAARGGTDVTPAEFEAATFPMPEGIERYVWFRSTRSSNSELQITGALKPNPLGLHDILGNADEIILESFRLYRAGGARGQSGGYVVKGGNYQTPETDIRSSYRHEISPFDDSGPRRVPTVGYRLALVAAVIPSRERLDELKRAPPAVAAKPPAPVAQPAPAVTVTPEAMEFAAWSAILSTTDPAVLEAFLKRFPDGVYAGIARAKIDELRAKAARDAAAEARRAEEARRAAAEEARRREEETRRREDDARRAAAEEARRREEAARRDAWEEGRRAGERIEQALGLGETERRRAQLGLAQKGLDPGAPDGVFGPQTRSMIAKFQQSRGEPQTGFLTRAQYEALIRDVRPPATADTELRARDGQPVSANLLAPFVNGCLDHCARINSDGRQSYNCRVRCRCELRGLVVRFTAAEVRELAGRRGNLELLHKFETLQMQCRNEARR